MKISIIIPTFNEEGRISDLIRLLKQKSSPKNIQEIIVVDGGSTDKTRLCANQEGAKVIISPRKGRGYQLNLGGISAKGEILYFLHADTFPPDKFDEIIISEVKKGYRSGCFRLRFDNPHPFLKFFCWWSQFDFKNGRGGDQSLFVHREIFEKVNGYNNNLLITEDLDIVQKIIKVSAFKVLPHEILTSARKYKKNGNFILEVIYTVIYFLYYFKVDYSILYQFYKKNIK